MNSKTTDVFSLWQEYGVDLPFRRVMLHAPIGPATESHEIGAEHVIRNLLWLDKSPGDIELWVDTPGGEVSEAWAIYDVIRQASNPIITVALGNVSSAGALVLAAGTGTRYAMPNASLMHHFGVGGVVSDYLTAQARAAWEAADMERWLRALARHSAHNYGWWKQRATQRGEVWMDVQGMVEAGVVDEIWRG